MSTCVEAVVIFIIGQHRGVERVIFRVLVPLGCPVLRDTLEGGFERGRADGLIRLPC